MTSFTKELINRIADHFCEYAEGDRDEIIDRLGDDREELISDLADELAEEFADGHNMTEGDCFICIQEGFMHAINGIIDWDDVEAEIIERFEEAWSNNREQREAMDVWN